MKRLAYHQDDIYGNTLFSLRSVYNESDAVTEGIARMSKKLGNPAVVPFFWCSTRTWASNQFGYQEAAELLDAADLLICG